MGVLRTLPSSSRMFSKAFLCSLDLEKEVGLMGSLASLPPCLSCTKAFSPELASGSQRGRGAESPSPECIYTCVPALEAPQNHPHPNVILLTCGFSPLVVSPLSLPRTPFPQSLTLPLTSLSALNTSP